MVEVCWTSITYPVLNQPYTHIFYSDNENYKKLIEKCLSDNKDKNPIVKYGSGKYQCL